MNDKIASEGADADAPSLDSGRRGFRDGGIMRYFAEMGAERGPVHYRSVPDSMDVLATLDDPDPIGRAYCVGWDRNGLAVWELVIGDDALPGRYIVIDRRFYPARSA